MPGKHINHLKRRSGTVVDAVVIEGGREEALYWHQKVELPYIANSLDFRLDRNWNWPRKLRWFPRLQLFTSRNTAFFQINVNTSSGAAFPVGQIFVSDGFPFFPGQCQESIFLWLLAAAPPTALRAQGLPADLQLMPPLVDVAIQFSFERGYKGLLTLHAASSRDKSKDRALYRIYERDVGLIPYKKRSLRVSTLRYNDGRYFYADEERALELTKKLNYLR